MFQTLTDLPESFEQDEGTNSRRAKHPEDVFVLTKEYISSTELRQKPLLVMTPENRDTYPLTTTSNYVFRESMFWNHWFFIFVFYVKFWTIQNFKITFFLPSTLNHIQFSGIIPTRPVAPNTRRQWKDLAQIFVRLLGGNASCQQAANYLNALADDRLPAEEVIPLTWHEEASVIEVMPIAREEPHPVVLATLSPSVPLRAVWRRRRWYKSKSYHFENHTTL